MMSFLTVFVVLLMIRSDLIHGWQKSPLRFRCRRDLPSRMTADSIDGLNSQVGGEDGDEVEKYKLRAKILEEALLTMRARYKGGGDGAGVENPASRLNILGLKEELQNSEKTRSELQLIINEAQKDVERFQERTNILEATLSRSREKMQSLERNLFDAKSDRKEMNAEMKAMREENSRLISDLEHYEGELLYERKAIINGRKRVDGEVKRLQQELNEAQNVIKEMEADYSAKVAALKAELQSAHEKERVQVEQLQLMIQSARTEAAELKMALDVKDRKIVELELKQYKEEGSADSAILSTADLTNRLERTTELLESAITLLSASNENSRSRTNFGTREGNIGSQAAEYLIAGDLRDQRRILEIQSDLLNKLLSRLEASNEGDRRPNWYQQSNGSNKEHNEETASLSSSRMARQLPVGIGVSMPRDTSTRKRGIQPRVVLAGRKALHGVKRGLGFLVGIEVPPYEDGKEIIYIEEIPAHFGDASKGWEDDLRTILHG